MKYLAVTLLFSVSTGFAQHIETKPSIVPEQAVVTNEGINFQEWESEFDSSITKARTQVKICEAKSKNCQFEKFQAIDPSFDMVH